MSKAPVSSSSLANRLVRHWPDAGLVNITSSPTRDLETFLRALQLLCPWSQQPSVTSDFSPRGLYHEIDILTCGKHLHSHGLDARAMRDAGNHGPQEVEKFMEKTHQ